MGTHTSDFGSGKRESHDASAFYRRFESPEISKATNVNLIPPNYLDRIFKHSSEDMYHLPDDSVALMVTSPPYHAGKQYDTDQTFDEYLEMLRAVMTETYRVLEPGGRAIWNVAGLGRKPYIALQTLVDEIAVEERFLPRGQIIWVKGKGAGGNCAWGSWLSPKNPTLRDLHEYLLVYSKGRFDRVKSGASDISPEEFMEYTLSVWYMHPESAKRVGHPAPFPVELPRRFIKLYTFPGDVVLDPFMGAGATGVAAKELGRHFIGYDTDAGYAASARKRIEETIS